MRCTECGMLTEACLCGTFTPLQLKTRVHIVLHAAEVRKSSNTGRIARLLLSNSTIHLHGHVDHREPTILSLSDAHEPVVLFPDGSEVLAAIPRPVELIVLDATWSQALKMGRRIEGLKQIKRKRLPALSPLFILRKAGSGRLSTMESIIQALSILEGEDVGRELMQHWSPFAKALLAERGKIPGRSDYSERDLTGD